MIILGNQRAKSLYLPLMTRIIIDVIRKTAHFFEIVNMIRHDIVEDMVATLLCSLINNTGLLQQVVLNISTGQFTVRLEVNTDEFTKSRRVVIPGGLGITKGFQYRVGGDNLIFQGSFGLLAWLQFCSTSTDITKVGDDLFGVLSLTSTGLTSDKHRLILVILSHVSISIFRDGEDVGRAFITPFAHENFSSPLSVDGVALVGVDSNTEETRVGIHKLADIASLQIIKYRGIIEICQVRHINSLLKLGRIDGLDYILLELLWNALNHDFNHVTFILGDFTKIIANIGI